LTINSQVQETMLWWLCHLPSNVPGEYSFHFRGTPNKEMCLQLYAEGMGFKNEPQLTHLETTIEAVLVDQDGRTVCQATGSPLVGAGKIDNDSPKGWLTMLAPDEAAYSNGNCLRMRLKPSHSYTLTIRILDLDPNTQDLSSSDT
jgi:hypothetical protein